jgi:hypothetical protein
MSIRTDLMRDLRAAVLRGAETPELRRITAKAFLYLSPHRRERVSREAEATVAAAEQELIEKLAPPRPPAAELSPE